jgi:hypothetical protein
MLRFPKVAVDGSNAARAFARRGRDAFHRAGTDVSDGEDPGFARLERQGFSGRPAAWSMMA